MLRKFAVGLAATALMLLIVVPVATATGSLEDLWEEFEEIWDDIDYLDEEVENLRKDVISTWGAFHEIYVEQHRLRERIEVLESVILTPTPEPAPRLTKPVP